MIEMIGLTKQYGNVKAVDSLDLKIEAGEFFALLGPNGAGKSTIVGMLSTLLIPDKGEIRIDGKHFDRGSSEIKKKISLVTQEYSLRLDMNMAEIMEYQGRLYYMKKDKIKQRTEELFALFGLKEHEKKRVRTLSGGMKRRLMVCRALLTEPEILLLDEPTAGMDAFGRRDMWNILKDLNKEGLTILLTTHYIEEAEELCSRAAMIDRGHLIKLGTMDELKGSEKSLEDVFLDLYGGK